MVVSLLEHEEVAQMELEVMVGEPHVRMVVLLCYLKQVVQWFLLGCDVFVVVVVAVVVMLDNCEACQLLFQLFRVLFSFLFEIWVIAMKS